MLKILKLLIVYFFKQIVDGGVVAKKLISQPYKRER